jgi:hypothetical protein
MTSIRIAIAAALAVGALLAGTSAAHHAAPAQSSVGLAAARPAGVIGCCDNE